jgi:hypothetical protein
MYPFQLLRRAPTQSGGRDLSPGVTPMGMKLVASGPETHKVSEIETVALSEDQYEMLRKLSQDLDPHAHLAFGGAHAIRTLLERMEAGEIAVRSARKRRR